jgi:hypothetical protein
MQLGNINGLYPIVLGATMLTFDVEFIPNKPFSKIDTIIQDNSISDYYKSIESNFYDGILTRLKFEEHLRNWEKKTMFHSSISKIVGDRDFQSIVVMGLEAVPFILLNLEQKPSHLVWALNLIFNTKISKNPNITVTEACKLWIKKLTK